MLVPLIKQSILFRVILASPVHVELGVHAAEFVRLILAVVSSQVVIESGHHVCMLLTSTDRREQIGGSFLRESSTEHPHGEDDSEEEGDHNRNGLLA